MGGTYTRNTTYFLIDLCIKHVCFPIPYHSGTLLHIPKSPAAAPILDIRWHPPQRVARPLVSSWSSLAQRVTAAL